jgi:hypothetical protein
MGRMLLVLGVLASLAGPSRAVDREAIDRAVENGVNALRRMQQVDGNWRHEKIGATALAGITLLECGADKDDKAVQSAAAKVREATYKLTDTYSLSLCVLFLDLLDNPSDTPLIESMLVRLIAGHNNGRWGYECPSISEEEVRRLKAESGGGERVLEGSRDLKKLPPKGKRKAEDLAKEIQQQLSLLAKAGAAAGRGTTFGPMDHSNTQFATIALWVGRRYGIPAQEVLLAIDRHYRACQNSDGTWGYMAVDGPGPGGGANAGYLIPPGAPGGVAMTHSNGTAAMTCAGLLGLAVGHGASLDIKKRKNPKLESSDVSKDMNIAAGLRALATAVGKPTGWSGTGKPKVDITVAEGKSFYYLWSLERVAVAYNIETLSRKDWFNWGAEVLLNSQKLNGSWSGDYGDCGADTCFALLFLKRANLMRDLSSGLRGAKGMSSRSLRAGGVGGDSLKNAPPPKGFDPLAKGSAGGTASEGSKTSAEGGTKTASGSETKPPERPRRKPRTDEEAVAAKLVDDLLAAKGERRSALLKELRDSKGPEFTEALADVIGRLDVEERRQAREALADRLTRMKPATLRNYLKDEDVEIRRAAALAVAQKDAMTLVPDLIKLLSDPESLVERAAHAALKAMAGKDLGPRAGADRSERAKAIAAWQLWWQKKARE